MVVIVAAAFVNGSGRRVVPENDRGHVAAELAAHIVVDAEVCKACM